jgi:cell wall-associated NlpC family hydrolase
MAYKIAGREYTGLPTDYGRVPRPSIILNNLAQHCDNMPLSDRQPGDIIVMKLRHHPQHLALYVGGSIIHSYMAAGRVVEHELDDNYIKKIYSVYRVR